MAFNLVCVVPFHGYEKGQMITDPAEVASLSEDREHHFVRVAAPDPEPAPVPPPIPAAALAVKP